MPKDAKLKIALISTPLLKVPPDNYGGLEQVVYDFGQALAEKGHDVTIYAPNGSKVDGCKIVETGQAKGTLQCDWLKAEREIFERFGKEWLDFDIVHGHNWFGYEYAAKIKAIEEKRNLAVCHTFHGSLDPNWWAPIQSTFNLNLLAISKSMQNSSRLYGFRSNFVYNGINLRRYPISSKEN